MVVNDKDNDQITDSTFLYFGSANFSPSAWGEIEVKSKKNNTIHIPNWELGIALPPEKGSASLKREMIDSMVIKLCKTGREGSK